MNNGKCYAIRNLQPAPATTSNGSDVIETIKQKNLEAASAMPPTVNKGDIPWLERIRLRNQLSAATREGVIRGTNITIERQLKTMEIAAEGCIIMASQQWDSLVQLHGARTTTEFASVFKEMRNSFMEEVAEAAATASDRAAREAARIEAANYPEFIKEVSREENLRRFHQEIADIKSISDRIGALLATRINQNSAQ